ncbi:DUF2635 domain-containing protein [Bordetella bronchiseptica]|uniref:DUF2635 domain-containing protein n=1 Tax=Bordetella bronchiseptica TaxID=518 RepID=UPI000460AF61|nr:DUF2635 domain-containing protein [Bordetella bronchiseptica]KDD50169.1 PF10948 family protein [Bordetella bronchiseptica MBORD901]
MAKIEIHVVPAPDRSVPDPARGDLLPADGRKVVRDPYWIRRIEDKDVTVTKPDATKKQERR